MPKDVFWAQNVARFGGILQEQTGSEAVIVIAVHDLSNPADSDTAMVAFGSTEKGQKLATKLMRECAAYLKATRSKSHCGGIEN